VRRAIVAFPAGDLAVVEAFRRAHDPLAGAMPAHVTLVFPFASTLSSLQVTAHARRVASRWPVIPIRLRGVDAYAGEWVHLRVTQGRDAVVELHDRLYRRALAPFLRPEFAYEPHVTIARAADAHACDRLVNDARDGFRRAIEASLRTLTVIALSGDGRVDVEHEIGLGI
jgi:2'-5' RNA ligase